ncbi:MAG: phosphodiester glycosidase family protein [Clostridia bacterium]|nr:phosphodiester glycosidase family protein [Clostridia bacterium]
MKRRLTSFLALAIALITLLGSIPAGAVLLKGDKAAEYTVTNAETHVLGDGLVYNEYSFNYSDGKPQSCFALEFNPKESDFRSYVYHTKASNGYTVMADAKNAYKEGLEVYAAINGDFFSMESANYGTPIGMYVTEGKLVVSTVGLQQYNLVIAEDGTADVVYSRLAYGLKIGGVDYSSKLSAINKRAVSYGADAIYFFDRDLGYASPVPSAETRTEIVCDITEGVLSVGGILKGTVNKIASNGATAIGENQFILSAGANIDLTALEVGAEVSLHIVETVEESKEAMENAYHAIYAHQTMKVDGYDRWANGDINDPGLSDQFAPRSVLGIKEDGTIVYFVCDGRKNVGTGTNGFNYDMLMELMEPYNCTDIINFDGGGSTAAVISEGDGRFNYEYIGASPERPVANTILIVRDPDAEPLPEKQYEPITDTEGTELRNVALNKSYVTKQFGNYEPSYLSTVTGDTGKKLTNGYYRTAEDKAEKLCITTIDTGHQLNVVMDLEKERTDIRNITWRGVSVGGNRSFDTKNVIVFFSDDGQNWGTSAIGTLNRTNTAISGVYDFTYSFTEAQKGRYVKVLFGTDNYALQFDELEVYAMVDVNEPKEEPIPEVEENLPADEPSDRCVNVALGKSYEFLCNGAAIEAYNSSADPRYYSKTTAETTPPRLTDGKLGTSGSFSDNCTLAIRSGSNKPVSITIDLGEVVNDIEFVCLRNIIENGSSFGKLDSADFHYSVDGETYTTPTRRLNSAAVTNTHYYNLTLQANDTFSARYIKVTFDTPTFLFGLGEVQVLTKAPPLETYTVTFVGKDGEVIEAQTVEEGKAATAPEAPAVEGYAFTGWDKEFANITEDITVTALYERTYALGDVNLDGKVNSLDAALVLRYDADLYELTEQQKPLGDVTNDGKVNSLDAAMILRYDADLIEGF